MKEKIQQKKIVQKKIKRKKIRESHLIADAQLIAAADAQLIAATRHITNMVLISDTHIGCGLGLSDLRPIHLDDGGTYRASRLQRKIWKNWLEFWDWVHIVTKGEHFTLVHVGDLIDGVHHNSTTQISHNLADQARMARTVMQPIIDSPLCDAYYQIRGTEAHVGISGVNEESIAESLGAVPDIDGKFARWRLQIPVGKALVSLMHHIGGTSSAAYESSAILRELISEITVAGQWGLRVPNFMIRGHRHRFCQVSIPSEIGDAIGLVLPGWQLKTPFVYKIGGRTSLPQMGGAVIRQGDEDVYIRHKVFTIEQDKIVKP